MPRDVRKQSKSGMYHIMLSGINRQDFFHDDEDYRKKLEVLEYCSDAGKMKIHAYCLMPNHVHLLTQTGKGQDSETTAQVMKRICVRYAKYYNYKYIRTGPLFQNRYKSETVETNEYFLTVLRYIHQEPVKAGMVQSPAEYAWSSYGAYTGKAGFGYTGLGSKLLASRFDSYMQEADETACLDIGGAVRRLTDTELSEKIEESIRQPAMAIAAFGRMDREKTLKEIVAIDGVTYRQISRVTGISPAAISRAVN